MNTPKACIAHQPWCQLRDLPHSFASFDSFDAHAILVEKELRSCDQSNAYAPNPKIIHRNLTPMSETVADDFDFHKGLVCEDIIPGMYPAAVSPMIKWNHSILSETDFKDEWSAQQNAASLAFQLQCEAAQSTPVIHCKPYAAKPRKPRSENCSVSFAPDVDLLIGLDEELSFVQISVPMQSLSMHGKPWSILTPIDHGTDVSVALNEVCLLYRFNRMHRLHKIPDVSGSLRHEDSSCVP